MSGHVNRVILIGRLGGDPLAAPNKGPVTFSLCTSQSWNDKRTGERREKPSWHNIVVFDQALAAYADEHLRKGGQAMVIGKLSTRKYEHKGATRYATEVIVNGFNCALSEISADDIGSGGGFRPGPGGARRPAPTLADHGYDEPGAREDDETELSHDDRSTHGADDAAHMGRQGSRASYQAPIEDGRGKSGPGEYFKGDPNAKPRTTYDTASTTFDKDRDEEIPF
jgi:single-strand DNA-binding protein